MRKPWTLRLVAADVGVKIAYAGGCPRFWTRRGAAKVAHRRNRRQASHNALWFPAFTQKDPW